jgi:hypothetical protein
MGLTMINGIDHGQCYNVVAHRDHLNEGIHEEPAPVLPQQLLRMGGEEFAALLEQQRERLSGTFSDRQIALLEGEFQELRVISGDFASTYLVCPAMRHLSRHGQLKGSTRGEDFLCSCSFVAA